MREETEVLVVGGGPAGSTAATLLAGEGVAVTLLEQARFPRYHVGESLLPSVLQILDLLGVRERVDAYGFTRKPGSYFEWGGETWRLDFTTDEARPLYSYQVVRSEFDRLLLEHARSRGVEVVEGVRVDALELDGDRPRRAYGAVLAAAAITSQRRGEVTAEEAIAFYEQTYRRTYLRLLVFVSTFYDRYRGKESYFWEAQRLTRTDCAGGDLKGAFLQLVAGLEDMEDLERGVHPLVLGEVSARLSENLALRGRWKPEGSLPAQKQPDGAGNRFVDNTRFFGAVAGLFALSPDVDPDGLFVETRPLLALRRARDRSAPAVADGAPPGGAAQRSRA